jgi:hypothetical protein
MPLAFTKGKTSNKTPRVRFDAISVGVNLALRENADLEPKSASWLNGERFEELITSGGQNAPSAIKARIEYVRDSLLGL